MESSTPQASDVSQQKQKPKTPKKQDCPPTQEKIQEEINHQQTKLEQSQQKQSTQNSCNDKLQLEETKKVSFPPTMQQLYMYGSAESDQFFIDENRFQARRPFELTFFKNNYIKLARIVCGGLHTLALTVDGLLYSWGCNDDHALGREGQQNEPHLVKLPCAVDLISAGDSHSVAANSIHSIAFQWGAYRNTRKGNMTEPAKTPTRIGAEEFKGKIIKKILSGSNHTLVHVEEGGKVFAWGDPDTCVLGRMPTARRRLQQGLVIESIAKNVEDIYTGGYHSFMKQTKTNRKTKEEITYYFSWGLNNYGQLGIGNCENSYVPTEIVELRNLKIINITGGQHHTIALTVDGNLYGWGRNDDGQLGLGEDWRDKLKDFLAKNNQANEMDQQMCIEESVQKDNKEQEQKAEKSPIVEKTDTQQQPQAQLSLQEQAQANEEQKIADQTKELNKADHLRRPYLIKQFQNALQIYSGEHFNYLVTEQNDVYSWGMGMLYVLGTREEEDLYEPQQVPKEFFKNQFVFQLGLGGQHVAAFILEDKNNTPKVDQEILQKLDENLKVKSGRSQRKLFQQSSNAENNNQDSSQKSANEQSNKGSKRKKDDHLTLDDIKGSLKKIKE